MKIIRAYLILSILPTSFALASSYAPFSDYGLVQNVQNYSTSPTYNPNGSYNQNPYPNIVYATGAEIGTAECRSIVSALVNSYCDNNNNCADKSLAEVRPNIMVGLSNLNGHNYITSCSGYIDSAFNTYKKTSYNVKYSVDFPTPTSFPKVNNKVGTIVNKKDTKKTDLEIGIEKRTTELDALQKQNGSDNFGLYVATMPKTINDVSFEEQVANKTAGYEPFKAVWGTNKAGEYVCIKNCSYTTPHFETKKEMYTRQAEEKTEQKRILDIQKELDRERLSRKAFCIKYPNDADCISNNLKQCLDENNNVMVNNGISVPCKTENNTDGTRTCIDGIWNECIKRNDNSGNINNKKSKNRIVIKI